jgi:hypothetical protein
MNTETTTLDLTPFLSTSASRYAFDKPFVVKGWRYFTDGRVCVRVPAPDEPDTDAPDTMKTANEVFPDPMPTDWHPWPQDGFIEGDTQCLTCDARGRINTRKCDECDGDGDVTCHACGHDHECDGCHGEGYTGGKRCPSCGGKCNVRGKIKQKIGGVSFGYVYARKILALPNPQYSPSSVKPARALAFKFDGGEGMLMCMND